VLGLVRLGGVLTLAVLGVFVAVSWRRDRRRSGRPAAPPAPVA
jgi:hypothetical protein